MKIIPYTRWLRLGILLCLLAATVSLTLSVVLPRLLDLNTYKVQLIEILQKQLKRDVKLGNASFAWMLRPSFRFSDLSVSERGSTDEFVSARQVSFKVAIVPLLHKKIQLHEIVLEGVQATVSRNKQGVLNIDDLLQPSPSGYDLQIKGVKVRNGTLFLRDQTKTTSLNLSGINLSLDKMGRGKKCTFKLGASLAGKQQGAISASGTLKLPRTGELLKSSDIDAKIDLKQVEYWRLWPYFGEFIPFSSPGGSISMNLSIKGHWQGLKAKGTLQVSNPALVWPTVFHGTVAPKSVQTSLELAWSPTVLDMPSVQVSLDGLSIKGSVRLSGLGSNDPSISARATSETFDYHRVRTYIPFGIIDDDVSDFIEHNIRGGLFKLTTGTLNGHISQLASFGVGDNASTLYINATTEQASIQYGEKTPAFRAIKGVLELRGRNFNLIGMSGIFGSSPFTLEGSMKEYATTGVPTLYPFSMAIAPHPPEVAWLAEQAGVETLRFQGTTTMLNLQGDGPSSAFRLSGEWLLNQAAYEYPGIVRKPAGMANSLTFNAVLGKDATRFSSVSYQLLPLRLSGSGLLRYSETKPYLAFDLESNQFQLNNQLPILTDWQQYHLKGGVQAHILGSGNPSSIRSMQFSGNVDLNGFSFEPHPDFSPVTEIHSRISFKGNSLETSEMAIRYGSTPLSVKGRIASLQDSEAELFVTSPELNPADFGLPIPEKPLKIRQFSTHLGLRNGLLTIRNIAGKLPKTIFNASGTVSTKGNPDVNLRVATNYLDLEEVINLLTPSSQVETEKKQVSHQYTLKAHLAAETGTCHSNNFSKLSAFLEYKNGILTLHGLDTNTLGGRLSMHGQLAQSEGLASRWDLSFLLKRAKGAELLKLFGIGREVRGLATVQGKLTASGDELETIKKTAAGTLTIKMERGTLRRFNTLSKIISILNVSQLLKFSLPDMARDGMPFNHITATVAVKDGILTTQDFFIDSNVMHVTTVGSIDVIRKTLDMLIGAQPLQTVDRIVSRIPVVGWILSGGDGSLVTTYFEAKGSWDDPEVIAIPVQSMASGAMNIFRRIFELPVRLFTDTGEVFLGNQKERPKAKP